MPPQGAPLHGDLRQLNILYSSNDERAFLVDFDWVGKHQVDRYSACLNIELGLDVDRWDLMRKSDDSATLERVMQCPCRLSYPSAVVVPDSACWQQPAFSRCCKAENRESRKLRY